MTFSGGETPVPIPNTAVKPSSADGTCRATDWKSRTSPGFIYASPFHVSEGGFALALSKRPIVVEDFLRVEHMHGLGCSEDIQ